MTTSVDAYRPAAQVLVAYFSGFTFPEGTIIKLEPFIISPSLIPHGIPGIAVNVAGFVIEDELRRRATGAKDFCVVMEGPNYRQALEIAAKSWPEMGAEHLNFLVNTVAVWISYLFKIPAAWYAIEALAKRLEIEGEVDSSEVHALAKEFFVE